VSVPERLTPIAGVVAPLILYHIDGLEFAHLRSLGLIITAPFAILLELE